MLRRQLLFAIGAAAAHAGGDINDVEDLIRTWERLERASLTRVDRMLYEASNVRCCCADGGELGEDGRCGRCFGRKLVAEGGKR